MRPYFDLRKVTKSGVKAVAVVFPVVTAVASALPVVVDRVAGRYKAARVLLLGKAA